LPHLFWIDHVKARLKLIELVFANSTWTKVYTIDDIRDLAFRYADLKPWAIVLDEKSIPLNDPSIIEFFKNKDITLIHLSEQGEDLQLQNISLGRISRTLKPMEIEAYIKNFFDKVLKQNGGSDIDLQTNRSH